MDIHKPKPWHGWRELLKEVGTIVLGVLIALAAEAVVENLHERRLSREAREAVRAEIALDLANVQRREQWQTCVDARLAELSDLLLKAERGERFDPIQTIGNPGAPNIHTEVWDAATAGGRTSLLSLEEQRGFGRLYTEFAALYRQQAAEDEAWGDLMAIEGVTRPSPELMARTMAALGHAKLENFNVRNSLRQAAAMAARIDVRPTPADLVTFNIQASRELLCMPVTTPRDEAAKRVRDPLGAY